MRQKKVIAFDWDDTLAALDENPSLFPDVKEMLQYLHEHGYEVMIITAREKPEKIRALLDKNQLNFITDENISSPHNVATRYPDEEKFVTRNYQKSDIMEKHRLQKNYQKEDYLLVDDHPGHVKKAQDAGFDAVQVPHVSQMQPFPRAGFFKEFLQIFDLPRQQKAALRNYISDRDAGAKHLTTFLFGVFKFGVPKEEKLPAAQAVLTNLENGTAIDEQHNRALGQGRLGKLYQGMLDEDMIKPITPEALKAKQKEALRNYISQREAGAKYLNFFNFGVAKDAKIAAAQAALSYLDSGTAIPEEHNRALNQGRLGNLYRGIRN